MRVAGEPRLLEHVRAHHQVRVPVAARVRAVRADPADLGREVEDELGPASVEEPRGVVHRASGRSRDGADDDVVALFAEALHEPRAEEPAAAGDEDAHAGTLDDDE